MDSELKQLEEELRGFAPSPMSGDVLARMVEAMDRWEEAEGETVEETSGKVVPFPREEKSSSWRPMWAAAAAVAVLGAAMGVLLPEGESPQVTAMSNLGPVPVLRQASLVPVNVQRKVRSMDAGMVSNKDGMEYQLIRVVRQEEADFKGGGDVGLKISRPKVDYYVVPVSY
ncbi:hypothetical protein [Roseibacillus persicicus]|uniref:Uncharacterized protein n=1 Tax=Roseibacillus persicicus TaxID=454148 RepID=A0A918TQT2_9BACT|nr:hypothetical protein [Roseibacillus persicicus]MDQ8189360.1 hypothetical protein [Roseibacillus persicicus]GHC55751.1 hypothetical protein GCM10007100_23170 [Roseibacillus persicicus]